LLAGCEKWARFPKDAAYASYRQREDYPMNPCLQVFLNDARKLWRPTLVYLMFLTITMVCSTFHEEGARTTDFIDIGHLFYELLKALAYPSLWFLIASLIHKDTLAGNRQNWQAQSLTGWRIFSAKALFILIFILLPLFIGYIAVFKRLGLPLYGHMHELLIKIVVFTVLWVLPAIALASVVRNLLQMMITVIAGFSLIVILLIKVGSNDSPTLGPSWGEFSWVRETVMLIMLLAGAIAVLFIQYKKRRTKLARAAVMLISIAVIYVAIFLPPVSWASAVQKQLSKRAVDDSAARIVLDLSDRSGKKSFYRYKFQSGSWLRLPIRIENLPSGLTVQGTAAHYALRSGESSRWNAGWHVIDGMVQGELEMSLRDEIPTDADFNQPWLELPIDTGFYKQAKDSSVQVAGFIDMTLFEHDTVRIDPGNSARTYVPGAGVCNICRDPSFINCRAIWPRAYLETNHNFTSDICAPWPTRAFFTPVESTLYWYHYGNIGKPNLHNAAGNDEITRPVAHIRRYFEFKDLRLRDYFVNAASR
jgi:hypothetical protein